MSLALASTGYKFKVIGNEMNFPTHLEGYKESSLLNDIDPFIIHYHSCFDSDGYINRSKHPLVNNRITQFNNRLRKERGMFSLKPLFDSIFRRSHKMID
jgi:hypothetical protein